MTFAGPAELTEAVAGRSRRQHRAREVVRVRQTVFDLTRSMLTWGSGRDGFGQLGRACERHGVRNGSFASLHQFEPDDTKSFFVLDREACILCGRCTVA